MRFPSTFRVPMLILAALLPAASAAEQPEPGRYLVKFADPSQGRAAVFGAGGTILLELGPQSSAAVALSPAAAEALANNPHIELVEFDPPRYPLAQTVPYGIDLVQAPLVWAQSTGANRKVCVIDSGVYTGHADLQPSGITGYPSGWDRDLCGHGTHVTGTIAALDNQSGVVGVLPNGVSLHMVKVFGDRCSWTYASNLVDALNRCRGAGANVVSMSLGGGFKSFTEQRAFNDAYAAGVLSVAAAGNGGNSAYSYPASYGSVLSVAAVDSNQQVASFSQYNSEVELAAPGVGVLSTVPWLDGDYPGSGYEAWSGTSMATPHVAGVAALVWSYNPAWTNEQIRGALQATARDLGAAGRDNHYGYGLVQAKEALDQLIAGAGGGGGGGGGAIVLNTAGYRVKNSRRVDLTWSGASGDNVDVYRNGAVVVTTANDGAYTDSVGKRGSPFTYKVCEAGTATCSNESVVVF